MVVVEPDLDCDVLVRLGDVGVLRGGEGVVVVPLVGGGVGVDKDGLARLDDAQPGATCSRLTIVAARAKMVASGPSVVDARNWPQLSTFVQTLLHLSPQWERVTLGAPGWIEEVPDSIRNQDNLSSQ